MRPIPPMAKAAAAMALVGGAVTASTYLTGYPRFGAQAVRYLAAAAVLAALVGRSPCRLVRPVGREWWWLTLAATSGLTVYNLAVVRALDTADPTLVATVVSGVPLALALGAPLAARRPVPARLVGAAAVVVAGAALVQGGGHADLAGITFSLLALAGECGFTLLSVPVLPRLGAFSVATHTSWLAAAQLTVLALATDGLEALPRPDITIVAAVAYLAAASALAFTLWFLAVDGVGGGRAGLAAGVIPAAAVASGLPLGVATVGTRTVAGLALVAAGLAIGLHGAGPPPRLSRRAGRPGDRRRRTRRGDGRDRGGARRV